MSIPRPGAASGRPLALLRLAVFGTQVALAEALAARGLAVTQQAISKWERGEAIPTEARLELLCTLLSLTPAQLERLFWPQLLGEFEGDARLDASAALKGAGGVSIGRRTGPPVAAGDGAPASFSPEAGR